nr:MAG TPA: hypothetical protein [Caudoviricetes sp.]DAN20175.1 MAG TPA: hypothetical protein [Caudoviricetes sp.]
MSLCTSASSTVLSAFFKSAFRRLASPLALPPFLPISLTSFLVRLLVGIKFSLVKSPHLLTSFLHKK